MTGKRRVGQARTPAMAAGLTDHVWSVWELLCYKVAPPAWVAPKRRGRPRTRPLPDPRQPKRPRGRPRKEALCSSTSYWGTTVGVVCRINSILRKFADSMEWIR